MSHKKATLRSDVGHASALLQLALASETRHYFRSSEAPSIRLTLHFYTTRSRSIK